MVNEFTCKKRTKSKQNRLSSDCVKLADSFWNLTLLETGRPRGGRLKKRPILTGKRYVVDLW